MEIEVGVTYPVCNNSLEVGDNHLGSAKVVKILDYPDGGKRVIFKRLDGSWWYRRKYEIHGEINRPLATFMRAVRRAPQSLQKIEVEE